MQNYNLKELVGDYYTNHLGYFRRFTISNFGGPVVLFVGPSGVGKDTVATLFAKLSRLQYRGSTSSNMLKHIYTVGRSAGVFPKYPTAQDFYNDRHTYKEFFFNCCNAFRDINPLVVPIETLRKGANIVTGIRSLTEVSVFGQYCDVIYWVERAGVFNDPTLEFSYTDLVDRFPSKLRVFVNRADMAITLRNVLCELGHLGMPIDLTPGNLSGFNPAGLHESVCSTFTPY